MVYIEARSISSVPIMANHPVIVRKDMINRITAIRQQANRWLSFILIIEENAKEEKKNLLPIYSF